MKAMRELIHNRFWECACAGLLLIAGILTLTTAPHYGDSWDEAIRAKAGELKLEYYQHLLSGDISAAREIGSRRDLYPGFHDLNLALLRRMSPLSDHLTGNLFSAFLGLTGTAGAMFLAYRFWNIQAAFWTGLLLLATPSWYGHLFINPKDIPFASAYIWSLAAILYWVRRAASPGWGIPLLTGLATGVATACRIGGLVLLCYLALFLFGAILYRGFREKDAFKQIRSRLLAQIPKLVVAGVVCFAVLLIYWPYGQWAPFDRAEETLQNVTQYDWSMPVLFQGMFHEAPELPYYYILKMMLIKIPVMVLVLFVAGCAFTLTKLWEVNRKGTASENEFHHACLLFAVLFPISYVIVKDAVLYNGLRHLLFIVPPMCILAGAGLERIRGLVHGKLPNLKVPAYAGIVAMLSLTILQMVRLHPYQYVYFNELAGGTARASSQFETDYWGTVYKELAEEFAEYLNTASPSPAGTSLTINMEHVTWLFEPFIREATGEPISIVRSAPQADDFFVSSTSWSADQFYYGKPVVEISRIGIRLGVVKDRRGLNIHERQLGYQPGPPQTP
ncbi:MAG: ArnT family glycosyltransferase [Puniceicoccaceae bacterium]